MRINFTNLRFNTCNIASKTKNTLKQNYNATINRPDKKEQIYISGLLGMLISCVTASASISSKKDENKNI